MRSTGFVHAWVSPSSNLCMSLKWSHNLLPWNLDLAFHCHSFSFVFSLTSLKVSAYATASAVFSPVTHVECALFRINMLTSSPPYIAAMFHYTLFCSCMTTQHCWPGSMLPACGDSLRRPRSEQETSFTSSRTSDMWVHDNYIHIICTYLSYSWLFWLKQFEFMVVNVISIIWMSNFKIFTFHLGLIEIITSKNTTG